MIVPLCEDRVNSGNTFDSCIDIVMSDKLISLIRKKAKKCIASMTFLPSVHPSVYFSVDL